MIIVQYMKICDIRHRKDRIRSIGGQDLHTTQKAT